MHSLIVYVAGAYRADTESGVYHNIQKARRVAEQLWAKGWPTICPHLNSAYMGGVAPDEVFLQGGLLMLERCDRVVLVPGWIDSAGTRAEIAHARARGLPVFATVESMETGNEYTPHRSIQL